MQEFAGEHFREGCRMGLERIGETKEAKQRNVINYFAEQAWLILLAGTPRMTYAVMASTDPSGNLSIKGASSLPAADIMAMAVVEVVQDGDARKAVVKLPGWLYQGEVMALRQPEQVDGMWITKPPFRPAESMKRLF